jgi:hypothetical protein
MRVEVGGGTETTERGTGARKVEDAPEAAPLRVQSDWGKYEYGDVVLRHAVWGQCERRTNG